MERRRTLVTALCAAALLSACTTEARLQEMPASRAPTSEAPTTSAAIPGDGTFTVGSDVQPGVYVGEGGEK